MFFRGATLALPLFSLLVATHPVEERDARRAAVCSNAAKQAGIQHEIDTITSHSFTDADQIPLAANATRTFYVTPNELDGTTLPPINVGVTGETVRAELVGLATVLKAYVPGNKATYIFNQNGSVTSDFIQNDNIALPHEHVREIHYFDEACDIYEIVGFVHGRVICPGGKSPISDPVIDKLCAELQSAKSK